MTDDFGMHGDAGFDFFRPALTRWAPPSGAAGAISRVIDPWLGGAVGIAAAAIGVLASAEYHPDPWWVWLPAQAVGVSFTVAGVIAWRHYPANGTGRLMVAVGATWYIVDLRYSMHPVLFPIGFCLFYLSTVIFTHLVLALPQGRLSGWPERLVVAGLYLTVFVTQPLRFLEERPVAPQSWTSVATYSVWAAVASVSALVLSLVALTLVLRRWIVAGRPARRRHALVWITAAVVGVVDLAAILATLVHAPAAVNQWLAVLYAVGLVCLPFAIVAGVLRVRLARIRVADLVLRLEQTLEPADVELALRDALGDPSLRVCFRLPDSGEYVDAQGGLVGIHGRSSARAITFVERRGEPLAALIHDPTLADQRSLVDAVVAAARLALDNARLLAAQRAQLEEVRASRARIVAAADAERRRIQRDLHDGAQHKLLAISMLVGRAGDELKQHRLADSSHVLDTARWQLRDVIRELRELTEGILPPALAERGLAAVVEALAERAPVPVLFEVPRQRWAEEVERTAYFVINEALVNVYKHASARQASVHVCQDGPTLVVQVVDDGVGGVDPDNGSGLRGLRDRVAAAGGVMRVESRPGAGTRVVAELPCAP